MYIQIPTATQSLSPQSLHGRLERVNNLGYLLLCSHTILRHCSMCQQLWCQSKRYYIVGLRGLHSPARLLLMPIRFVLCCYGNRCCSEPHPLCISKGVSAQLASAGCRQLVRYEILSHRSVYQRYTIDNRDSIWIGNAYTQCIA